MGPHYRMVRLNMRQHRTRALAFEDMVAIVKRSGYWTQNDNPPPIPVGTSVIGMGSYGGRGLYLHGVVAGAWASTSGPTFHHKLPVTWAHAVYRCPANPKKSERSSRCSTPGRGHG